MKVKLKPLDKFEIILEGEDFEKHKMEVTLKSRWNGMAELQTDNGQSLIIDNNCRDIGDNLLHTIFEEPTVKEGEYTVIKISPALANKLGFKEAKDGQKG